MRLQPTTRKVRLNKKLKRHISQSKKYIRELRATYDPIDLQVANLIDESIAMNLLEYNTPGFSEGNKKAKTRLIQIQKEITALCEKRITPISSFNVTA